MIISTTQPIRPIIDPAGRNRGFTLVEVIIGSTLASFILAGSLSAFLMLGRSGMNISYYSQMETQIRRALETFSQDLRMASNVTWNSSSSLTLTVPDSYATAIPANTVTYAYDSIVRNFYYVPGNNASATIGRVVLLNNASQFSFTRFNRLDAPATTDVETKRIQLSLTASYSRQTLVGSSQSALSASFILRNKVAN